MLTRTLSGALLLVLFLPILLFSHTVVLEITVALIAAVAVYEAFQATGYMEAKTLRIPAMFFAAYMPFAWRCELAVTVGVLFLLVALLFLISFRDISKMRYDHMAALGFLALYIPIFASFIVGIRRSGAGANGLYLVFIGAWISDTFAYLTGRALGRHKLCPQISPKKSVEGLLGGMVATGAAYALFGYIVRGTLTGTPHYVWLFVAGLLITLIGHLGDLAASYMKRYYQIKDFGKLIPGHGGILDRFDSMLFVAPALYVLLQLLPLFG